MTRVDAPCRLIYVAGTAPDLLPDERRLPDIRQELRQELRQSCGRVALAALTRQNHGPW
jgi:hypothetical protein